MGLRKWWRKLFHNGDLDAARLRVKADTERIQKTAERIDKSAGSLEHKVRVNHISATVSALLKGSR